MTKVLINKLLNRFSMFQCHMKNIKKSVESVYDSGSRSGLQEFHPLALIRPCYSEVCQECNER